MRSVLFGRPAVTSLILRTGSGVNAYRDLRRHFGAFAYRLSTMLNRLTTAIQRPGLLEGIVVVLTLLVLAF